MRSSNTRLMSRKRRSPIKVITSVCTALLLTACASTLDGLKQDIRNLSGSDAPEEGTLVKTSASNTTLIKDIQRKLTSLGYKPGDATGVTNARTEAAIQDFQLDNDMVIDGKPSKSLLRALNSQKQS